MIIASLGPSELSVMQRYLERFDCNHFIKHRMTEVVLKSLSKNSSSHQESTSKRQGYIEGVEIF